MRKVVVSEFVSLDGVMEDPGWTFRFSSEEQEQYKFAELAAGDALLLGRVTYEGFAAGLAALGLIGLMAGATLTNGLVLGTSPLLPIALMLVSALVAWGRWPRSRTLFTNREPGRLQCPR